MTEFWRSQRVHKLCTTCALALCLGIGTVQAGPAWDMFQARCLDPFEHQAEPVVQGLEQADKRSVAQLVFHDDAGLRLVVDAAPEDGLRACAVSEDAVDMLDPAYLAWVQDVTQRQVYVPEDGMLASAEWIEPQVHVEATLTAGVAIYRVLETDLES